MYLIRWWAAAGVTSGIRIIIGLVGLLLGLAILRYIGIDEINNWDSSRPLLWVLSAAVGGILSAVYASRAWFGHREVSAEYPLEPLRRDRLALWWLVGVMWVSLLAAGYVFAVSSICDLIAQRLPGAHDDIVGVVTEIREAATARSVCRTYTWIRPSGSDTSTETCLSASTRRSLANAEIHSGETVVLHVKDTPLGRVVQAIEGHGRPGASTADVAVQ